MAGCVNGAVRSSLASEFRPTAFPFGGSRLLQGGSLLGVQGQTSPTKPGGESLWTISFSGFPGKPQPFGGVASLAKNITLEAWSRIDPGVWFFGCTNSGGGGRGG